MAIVYLGVGSNLGFRRANLDAGENRLRPYARMVRSSTTIESEPMGPQDQPRFLNRVIAVATELSPRTLLACIQRIEAAVGRRPTYRWGPRVLDLDLLIFDDLCFDWRDLVVPHPGLTERPFVMEPLAEIAPELASRLKRQRALLSQAPSPTAVAEVPRPGG